MLDLIVLGATQACATGTCPQQVVSASYVLAQPQVVAVASAVPGTTVIKYKRNLFGQLKPVYATVTSEVAVVESKSAKASSGSACKSCKN